MFQFATNVSKTIFGELLYICSSTVEKNLGDTAFHTLFVFVALRPMSTAMVIAGRSVHLTTLFPWQA